MCLQLFNPNPSFFLTQLFSLKALSYFILTYFSYTFSETSSILTRGILMSRHYGVARICSQVQEILFFSKDWFHCHVL